MRTVKMSISGGYYSPGGANRLERLFTLKWAQYPISGSFIDLRKLQDWILRKYPEKTVYLVFYTMPSNNTVGMMIGKDYINSAKQTLILPYDVSRYGYGKSKKRAK